MVKALKSTPYIIVMGNEKGGTGKSTVTMHILTDLLLRGFKVGSIDLDARQGTLTRYVQNRKSTAENSGIDLPVPDHTPLYKSELDNLCEAKAEEEEQLAQVLAKYDLHDFVIIDTPGSDTYLSRIGHQRADTLITPLNDSFVDLDMLVRVDGKSMDIVKPSTYAEMVWEYKKQRLLRDGGTIDWIVLRNRLANVHSRNREEMTKLITGLAKRIGFRIASGFGERVIFRELFLSGLTLLDMRRTGVPMTLSHVSAKQELLDLVEMIDLPEMLKQKQKQLTPDENSNRSKIA